MGRPISLGVLLLLILTSHASADTLVCRDGRRLTGQVTQTPQGYIIKTKAGEAGISADEVSEWIKAPQSASGGSPIVKPPAGRAPSSPKLNPPSSDPIKSKATIDHLMRQGQEAQSAGQFRAARDAFLDVVELDHKNARALHALGLAYVGLNDMPKARDVLEKAMDLPPLDRALAINVAVVEIANRNPMRAARVIMNYLSAHSDPPDEPLLNAMAAAMVNADDSARGGGFFREAEQFYLRFNQKLEATRPGEKRWGLQWLPSAEVDRKFADAAKAQKELDKLRPDLLRSQKATADAAELLDAAKARFDRGSATVSWVTRHESTYNQKLAAQKQIADRYEEILATKPTPEFPNVLAAVPLDDQLGSKLDPTHLASTNNPLNHELRISADPLRTQEAKAGSGAPIAPATPIVVINKINVAAAQVTRHAAAFAVAPDLLVTSASAVGNARQIEGQTADGVTFKAELVRKDDASGLVLLRALDVKLLPLPMADRFVGGPIQCAAFPRASIFDSKGELVAGSAKPSREGLTVSMTRHPRLSGSPLLSSGKVVGIELAERDSDPNKIAAVGLEKLRQLCGNDLPATVPSVPDACDSLCQLTISGEAD